MHLIANMSRTKIRRQQFGDRNGRSAHDLGKGIVYRLTNQATNAPLFPWRVYSFLLWFILFWEPYGHFAQRHKELAHQEPIITSAHLKPVYIGWKLRVYARINCQRSTAKDRWLLASRKTIFLIRLPSKKKPSVNLKDISIKNFGEKATSSFRVSAEIDFNACGPSYRLSDGNPFG